MARTPRAGPRASRRSLPGSSAARCHLPAASVSGPQRPAEQAASRGSSAGRGGGGSWASAERAARCACAPPPPPPARGLNHPQPRARAAAGGAAGSLARTSSPVTQAPAGCFQVALCLGSQGSVQATIVSVELGDTQREKPSLLHGGVAGGKNEGGGLWGRAARPKSVPLRGRTPTPRPWSPTTPTESTRQAEWVAAKHSPPLLVTKSCLPASCNQSQPPGASLIIGPKTEVKFLLRSARQCSCVSPRVLTDRGVVQVCSGGEKLVLGAERRILARAFYRRKW